MKSVLAVAGAAWGVASLLGTPGCGGGENYYCGGSGSCEGYTETECRGTNVCAWLERCNQVACQPIRDEAACAAIPHCAWSKESGCYEPGQSDCDSLQSAACAARSDCSWGFVCDGQIECIDADTQNECATLGSHCEWREGSPDWKL
ncbi:MAG TPA: hypothetical protein VM686_24225 [Polyangiaceae bacterium]|nr:hypothetical protein [Polyangiaceae bacterium]